MQNTEKKAMPGKKGIKLKNVNNLCNYAIDIYRDIEGKKKRKK